MTKPPNPHVDAEHGWVIHTSFRDGREAWVGWVTDYWSGTEHTGMVTHRGNAIFYADEAEAHNTAYTLRESDIINAYSVERYEKPRLRTRRDGSSGRA